MQVYELIETLKRIKFLKRQIKKLEKAKLEDSYSSELLESEKVKLEWELRHLENKTLDE